MKTPKGKRFRNWLDESKNGQGGLAYNHKGLSALVDFCNNLAERIEKLEEKVKCQCGEVSCKGNHHIMD